MKKLFFTIAAACGCAFFAYSEQVQSWFSGGVESSTPSFVNGAWTSLPEGVTTNETSFTLELGYDKTLDFTPTANAAPDTNVVTRVTSEVVFVPTESELPNPPSGTKIAFMVSNTVYYAYASGAWVKLEGATPSGVAVVVLFEVDYKSSAPRARCGIITNNGATTNYLKAVGAEDGSWLALGDSGSTPTPALVGKVSFCGEGEVVSVHGDVQMGIFENDSIKYGTSEEAVEAAKTSGVATVKVLRDNNETITLSSGSNVNFDLNDKSCGEIVNNSGKAVVINMPEADVEKGNGVYTNAVAVSGTSGATVETNDESKEISSETVPDVGIVSTIVTKDSIVTGLTVAGKALTVNDTLKKYLTAYGGKTEGTYAGPSSSHDAIQGQLSATPTGATRTMGQSYALGLAPTDEIILQPAAADTSTTAVTLNMPNVKPNSDFTVKYKAQKYNGTEWVNVDESAPTDTPQIPVGSGRFRVNTVIAPAQ